MFPGRVTVFPDATTLFADVITIAADLAIGHHRGPLSGRCKQGITHLAETTFYDLLFGEQGGGIWGKLGCRGCVCSECGLSMRSI